MNYLRNKNFLIFVTILYVFYSFTSCKTKYDLSAEEKSSSQILHNLSSKKIIFLGENHDDVYVINYRC